MSDLKRFSFGGGNGIKIDSMIEFPFELKLANFSTQRAEYPTYELYGVINHHSLQADSGHYTAFCRDTDMERWYRYDDEKVTETEQSLIVSKDAYVLFYQQKV